MRLLFHRLNNQLGIILAHAELLEAKATDDIHRARAAQVVSSVLDALETARDICLQSGTDRSAENDVRDLKLRRSTAGASGPHPPVIRLIPSAAGSSRPRMAHRLSPSFL